MTVPGGTAAGVLLFGDGKWAADSLRRLLRSRHRVAGVVLRRRPSDGQLEAAAREAGLPVLQPDRADDPAFVAQVRGLGPDLVVSVAYDQILRRDLREVPRFGCLNAHAGALPRYRGRNVINWAIINGEREIGVTVHQIDDGIDTGDVVLQQMLPIGWTDTYGDVLARVVEAIPPLVERAVDQVADGSAIRRAQDHAAATYCGGRSDGDEWLDWALPSARVHNLVRGISRPGPGARTTHDGIPVTVWKAYCDPAWPAYLGTPGQVVGRSEAGVLVKTGDSTILLQEVEAAGATAGVPAWPIGTRLGGNVARDLCAALRRLDALESRKG
jgi:methionyl-tRNA formyltransferase